jgi:uncharacterized protein (DUF302 family)
MKYYFSKHLSEKSFTEAIDMVKESLKQHGFGVLTEIDVKATLKSKIDVDFKNYTILGACSPAYAYEALKHEDKVGVFLPCNVVVQQHETGAIEVSAVDPVASMLAIENESLQPLAMEIQSKLKHAIEAL